MSAQTPRPRLARRLDPAVIVLIVLLITIVIGAALVGSVGRNFFAEGNIRDILAGMSVLGLVAVGQTLVILAGSLDLSVPAVISLSSLIAAQTMAGQPGNIPAGIGLALLVAGVIGAANGLITTKLRVNGFITTLGVGLIVKGYLDSNYKGTAGSVPDAFLWVGIGNVGPVPVSTLLMLAFVILGWVFLTKTRTGHHLYAVGGDSHVARFSGVHTARSVIVAHIFCGLTAGLAGILLASRLGVGSPVVGTQDGYDLLSIAAVVLGGTLLTGGRGTIWGTLGGVAIFAVIDSTMSVLEVNPFLKDVARGIIIVLAVALYTGRAIERRRARFSSGGNAQGRPPAGALTHTTVAPATLSATAEEGKA